MELTFWICLNFLILNKHAAADSCIYPAAAAAATAVVLADSAPCRSTYTCEPLSAPLVTGSQHLRRCNVGKPQQDVMSHSRQKVLTRLLLSASVSQDKTRLFLFFFSEDSLLCFLYSSVRFLIFKLIQLWLRSWLLPTQVPEQMLATVHFCKTTEMLKLYFFLYCETFFFRFQFSISCCDNTVRVFCLGFRHQNHLVRVRKRSFLA